MNNDERYDEVGEKIMAIVKSYEADGLMGFIPILTVLHDLYFQSVITMCDKFGRSAAVPMAIDITMQGIDSILCNDIVENNKETNDDAA